MKGGATQQLSAKDGKINGSQQREVDKKLEQPPFKNLPPPLLSFLPHLFLKLSLSSLLSSLHSCHHVPGKAVSWLAHSEDEGENKPQL